MIEDILKLRAKRWSVKTIAKRLKLTPGVVNYLLTPDQLPINTWVRILKQDGLSNDEIQALTKVTPNTVRILLSKKLRPLSRFAGVRWKGGQWQGCAIVAGERVVLGYSPDEISCAWIRDNAIRDGQLEHAHRMSNPPERRKEPR